MIKYCLLCGGKSHIKDKTASNRPSLKYNPETQTGLQKLESGMSSPDFKNAEELVSFHNKHCGNLCHPNCELNKIFTTSESNLNLSRKEFQRKIDDDPLEFSLGWEPGELTHPSLHQQVVAPAMANTDIGERQCIICKHPIADDEPSVRWKTQRKSGQPIIDVRRPKYRQLDGGFVPGPLSKLKDYDEWNARYKNYQDKAQEVWKSPPSQESMQSDDWDAVQNRGRFTRPGAGVNGIKSPITGREISLEPFHSGCYTVLTSQCPAAIHRPESDFEFGTGGHGHFKPNPGGRRIVSSKSYKMSKVKCSICGKGPRTGRVAARVDWGPKDDVRIPERGGLDFKPFADDLTKEDINFHNEHCGSSCHKDCPIDKMFTLAENNISKYSPEQIKKVINTKSTEEPEHSALLTYEFNEGDFGELGPVAKDLSKDRLLYSLHHDISYHPDLPTLSPSNPVTFNRPSDEELEFGKCLTCPHIIADDEPSVRFSRPRQANVPVIGKNGYRPFYMLTSESYDLRGDDVKRNKFNQPVLGIHPSYRFKDEGKFQERYNRYQDRVKELFNNRNPFSGWGSQSNRKAPEGEYPEVRHPLGNERPFTESFLSDAMCMGCHNNHMSFCPAAQPRPGETRADIEASDFTFGTGGGNRFKPNPGGRRIVSFRVYKISNIWGKLFNKNKKTLGDFKVARSPLEDFKVVKTHLEGFRVYSAAGEYQERRRREQERLKVNFNRRRIVFPGDRVQPEQSSPQELKSMERQENRDVNYHISNCADNSGDNCVDDCPIKSRIEQLKITPAIDYDAEYKKVYVQRSRDYLSSHGIVPNNENHEKQLKIDDNYRGIFNRLNLEYKSVKSKFGEGFDPVESFRHRINQQRLAPEEFDIQEDIPRDQAYQQSINREKVPGYVDYTNDKNAENRSFLRQRNRENCGCGCGGDQKTHLRNFTDWWWKENFSDCECGCQGDYDDHREHYLAGLVKIRRRKPK